MVGHQADNVGSFKLEAACHTSTGSPTCTLMTMCTLMDREGPYSFNRVRLGIAQVVAFKCTAAVVLRQQAGSKAGFGNHNQVLMFSSQKKRTKRKKKPKKQYKHSAFCFARTYNLTTLSETDSGQNSLSELSCFPQLMFSSGLLTAKCPADHQCVIVLHVGKSTDTLLFLIVLISLGWWETNISIRSPLLESSVHFNPSLRSDEYLK